MVLGPWRALGILHQKGKVQRVTDLRAGEPSTDSHPEASVLPTTCHPLAIWTPVDGIYLNRGGGWGRQVSTEGGGQVRQASTPPPAPPLLTRVGHTSSAWPGRSVASFWAFTSHTFSVLSLLPLTRSRLSADHAIWYTAATWPRREARYLCQEKVMMGIRSSNTSEGAPMPTAVVLNLSCTLELPGNVYKISLPSPYPSVIITRVIMVLYNFSK